MAVPGRDIHVRPTLALLLGAMRWSPAWTVQGRYVLRWFRPRRTDSSGMTVWWNEEALERAGLDRERADAMLRLAHELKDLPSRVYSGPKPGESGDEWAERVMMSGSAPTKKATQVIHSASLIDRYAQLWASMYRDK